MSDIVIRTFFGSLLLALVACAVFAVVTFFVLWWPLSLLVAPILFVGYRVGKILLPEDNL